MSEVYKKFTAQDKAVIPFNAHKQYDFGSSSAALNQLTYFQTRWTSESISIYSSASSNPLGIFDPINNIAELTAGGFDNFMRRADKYPKISKFCALQLSFKMQFS